MFLVTNREVHERTPGLKAFGDVPNSKGPNELRLVEAVKKGNRWQTEVLSDVATHAMCEEVGLDPDAGQTLYASNYVACKLFQKLRKEKKNLLFFIHGYNNDIKAVLERADNLQRLYGVEVLAFSWPANGGGIRGVASYKSDKRDAKASVGGFDRALGRFHELLTHMMEQEIDQLKRKAEAKYPENSEKREQYYVNLREQRCPLTVNMMLHSMSNYLYKHTLLSSVGNGRYLSFDNVILLAADTNNFEHPPWVDRIPFRKALYITINENDSALLASRMKAGEAQQARLGHYRYNLYATQATYIDFTDAPRVGDSHAYFEADPVARRDSRVRRFFNKAFNGQRAEEDLNFQNATRMYRF